MPLRQRQAVVSCVKETKMKNELEVNVSGKFAKQFVRKLPPGLKKVYRKISKDFREQLGVPAKPVTARTRNSPSPAPCCANCQHVFKYEDYDCGISCYCTLGAEKRPLCNSCSMGEVHRKAYDFGKWVDWANANDVRGSDVCQSFKWDNCPRCGQFRQFHPCPRCSESSQRPPRSKSSNRP
jgi:hypothetical protein